MFDSLEDAERFGELTDETVPHVLYMKALPEWAVLFALSSSGLGVDVARGVLRNDDTGEQTWAAGKGWERVIPKSNFAAKMPPTVAGEETTAAGFSLSLCYQGCIEVISGDQEQLLCPPSPVVLMLGNDGILSVFSYVNVQHTEEGCTDPAWKLVSGAYEFMAQPQPLPNSSAMTASGVSPSQGASAPKAGASVALRQPSATPSKPSQPAFGGVRAVTAAVGLKIGQPAAGGLKLGQPAAGGLKLGLPAAGGLKIGQPAAGGLRLGQPAAGGLKLAQPAAAAAAAPKFGQSAAGGLPRGQTTAFPDRTQVSLPKSTPNTMDQPAARVAAMSAHTADHTIPTSLTPTTTVRPSALQPATAVSEKSGRELAAPPAATAIATSSATKAGLQLVPDTRELEQMLTRQMAQFSAEVAACASACDRFVIPTADRDEKMSGLTRDISMALEEAASMTASVGELQQLVENADYGLERAESLFEAAYRMELGRKDERQQRQLRSRDLDPTSKRKAEALRVTFEELDADLNDINHSIDLGFKEHKMMLTKNIQEPVIFTQRNALERQSHVIRSKQADIIRLSKSLDILTMIDTARNLNISQRHQIQRQHQHPAAQSASFLGGSRPTAVGSSGKNTSHRLQALSSYLMSSRKGRRPSDAGANGSFLQGALPDASSTPAPKLKAADDSFRGSSKSGVR